MSEAPATATATATASAQTGGAPVDGPASGPASPTAPSPAAPKHPALRNPFARLPKRLRRQAKRVAVALALFAAVRTAEALGAFEAAFGAQAIWGEFAAYLVPYLVAGWPVLTRAFKGIGHGNFLDENFLMSIATVGAFALVLFPGASPHMAEGAAVMLFYQVGELFEGYAVGRSRSSIADLLDLAPDTATVLRDGREVPVDCDELAVGDEVVVVPGGRVPIDGVLVRGEGDLDTAALTGEPLPRHVREGDEVLSGCVSLDARLVVRVTKPLSESTVTRILALVEDASEKKARTEAFITRFARVYTPLVVAASLVLAVGVPLAVGLATGDWDAWGAWVERGLVFLVVSCPCALVISVPLSFFGGIGGASRSGILIKGSNHLEDLAHVRSAAFDKTGTLTCGRFVVTHIDCSDPRREGELLALAAAAESASTHPVATSIVAAARAAAAGSGGVATASAAGSAAGFVPAGSDASAADDAAAPSAAPAFALEEAHEVAGLGVKARVAGHEVLVGKADLLRREGVDPGPLAGQGGVFMAVDGAWAVRFVLDDRPKPQAAEAVRRLAELGVTHTWMLSGDAPENAEPVARELGIGEVFAGLLPQQKVEVLEGLLERAPRKLAYVGDGINDAPVLMRADVGVAMGGVGSDAAIEAADVVLMDDDPRKLAHAVSLARATMAIVRENIVFALGVKFAVLGLAAFGLANLWMAVFADVGVAVLAIGNAMRALRLRSVEAPASLPAGL